MWLGAESVAVGLLGYPVPIRGSIESENPKRTKCFVFHLFLETFMVLYAKTIKAMQLDRTHTPALVADTRAAAERHLLLTPECGCR
jgi:hypothetical protein